MINIKAESIKNTENHYKIKKICLNKYVPNNEPQNV